MAKRIYLAPLPTNINTAPVVAALATELGELPTISIFDSNAGWPKASQWFGYQADQSAQTVLQKVDLEADCLIDGSLPQNLAALPVAELHAKVAAHLQAQVILILDGAGLSEEAITEQAHLAAEVMENSGCAPQLAVVYHSDVQITAHTAHIPVLTVPGEDLTGVDLTPVRHLVENPAALPVPPATFQAQLVAQAKQVRRTIVLPESEDDRVLQAAAQLQQLDLCDLVLLGETDFVADRAASLGIDLSGVQVVSPQDPQRRARYAEKLAELRAKKGVTVEQALNLLEDSAYFGTMMIVCGDADGMVSGAAHTTANTIRPALQLIKTKPGVAAVSGAFIMLYPGHQHLFADCAVTIDPTAEQLADIAAVSAETAAQFGIDPKVALISYSTGDSGSGPSVDKVKEAVALVKAAHPELAVDGPLQFDAANDPVVAAKKLPDSPVAGQANVYVFCHLDVGNCTYKAVQRTAGAVAVGPVLQGLNAPVNDLSRGALVEDIVNTVIITAVQAQ